LTTFWFFLSVGQGLSSVARPGDDDGILGVKRDGEAAAERRNALMGLVVARLAQAECGAVGERQENAQALALVDDIGDGAGQLVAGCVLRAVVDQQLFA